ncbi:MAG: MFS family permease [Chloroflexi bacterium]|jgi:EmrB/QacA subfamily drug resistance transporter|nr:MAG: MFS family permease [Chloroflexota bacterium]
MPGLSHLRASTPYVVLAAACAGVFNAALDQTTIVTALPEIMADLRLSVSDLDQVMWTVSGYLLGYTVAMPLMGRLSDAYGRRRIYLWALVVFCLGSAFVAVSTSLAWLVAARVVMAVGGGAVVPVTIALAGDLLEPKRRIMALALIGAAAEAGAVLGPLWAGLIINFLDWRWIFWLNLPFSGLIALLILAFVTSHRPEGKPVPVDYRAGLLLAMTLAVTTIGMSRWRDIPSMAIPLLALGGVLLFAYVWSQRRAPHPLIPLHFFRIGPFLGANVTHLFVGAAFIIALINVPLLTNTVMAESAVEGGLRLVRLTAAIPIGAILGGLLASKLGYRFPTMLGLGTAAVAFFLMSGWEVDVGLSTMTVHLVLAGLGFGLVIAPIASAAINSVPATDRGAAAALVTVMRMLGMTIGLAAIASYGTTRFDLLVGAIDLTLLDPGYGQEISEAGMRVFSEFFLAAMVLCLMALLPALLMRTERQSPTQT